MPMLHARRNPHDIAGFDFLDRTIPMLDEAGSRCDDQRLAEGMCMPGGARAGLEGRDASADAGRRGAWNRESTRTAPMKLLAEPALDGCDPARVTVII
jgi:hypothetical protein